MRHLFLLNGGMGKQISSLNMLKQFKEETGEAVGVVTDYPAVFERSWYVDKIFSINNGIVKNYFKWVDVIHDSEPYHHINFIKSKFNHISNIYKDCNNLKHDNSVARYTIKNFLEEDEELKYILKDFYTEHQGKNLAFLQVAGGKFKLDFDPRSFTFTQIEEIVKYLTANNYFIVMINDYNIRLFMERNFNTANMFFVSNYFELLHIVRNTDIKLILVDSYIQHVMNFDCVQKKSFVYWTKTHPKTFGYEYNHNFFLENGICPIGPCQTPFGTHGIMEEICEHKFICRNTTDRLLSSIENYLKEK